jgi:nitrate reductase gamma subunit
MLLVLAAPPALFHRRSGSGSLIQPFGKYAAFAMLIGLLGLWARRFWSSACATSAAPSDHLMLALLVAIGQRHG